MSWKWIKNFEGVYEMDRRGNVRRHFANGNIKQLKTYSLNGYDMIKLCVNHAIYVRGVDRLLYETHNVEYKMSKPIIIKVKEFVDCISLENVSELDLYCNNAWINSKEREYYNLYLKN